MAAQITFSVSATRQIDEFLDIMAKFGFVDPETDSKFQPSPSDEYRTAGIFFSWIRKVTSPEEAREKGVKIGQLIHSRAIAKEIKLRHVAGMLDTCGNWYLAKIEEIDTEVEQEKDDISLGRKVKKTVAEQEDRKKLKKICRFMMTLFSAAFAGLEEASKYEK